MEHKAKIYLRRLEPPYEKAVLSFNKKFLLKQLMDELDEHWDEWDLHDLLEVLKKYRITGEI